MYYVNAYKGNNHLNNKMSEEQNMSSEESKVTSDNTATGDTQDANDGLNNHDMEITSKESKDNDIIGCDKTDSCYVNKSFEDSYIYPEDYVTKDEKHNEKLSVFTSDYIKGIEDINNQLNGETTNNHIGRTSQESIENTEACDNAKESETNESEIKKNGEKYVKNSTFSVNFVNNGFSQIDLVTDPKKTTGLAPHWKQFFAAMGPYLMILSAGLSSGFSATLLPQLKEEQSAILVNDQSPSWIASMAALPMAPGCFIGGWLMEKLGRRHALCILSIPFVVGWVLIASASNLPLMLMGRFLNGLSIGLLAPSMSVFISETSAPKLRGMFLAFLSFHLALGIFVAHIIGTLISWKWAAAICALFPLFSAGLLIFIPESPVWYFSRGKPDEAIKSFYWLRGHSEEAETELEALIVKFRSIDNSLSIPLKQKFKNFRTPSFSKPLIIVITIYLTCQFAGVHVITFYSIDIINLALGKQNSFHPYMAMLAIDFLRVVTSLVTIFISRKCPRRTLCIVSGILTTASMAGLAIFLSIYGRYVPSYLTAIPLCLLSAYIIAINIGLMPLPWIIVGEIFPARFRSFGAGLASAVGYLSTFIVVKTAPGMMFNFGLVATFIFYGTVSLVGTAALTIILPETKGKSLLEIEKMFERKNVKNRL